MGLYERFVVTKDSERLVSRNERLHVKRKMNTLRGQRLFSTPTLSDTSKMSVLSTKLII